MGRIINWRWRLVVSFKSLILLFCTRIRARVLGKMIMKELKDWMMNKNVPKSGTVLLFADGRANELYRQFGFVETAGLIPCSVGMAYRY